MASSHRRGFACAGCAADRSWVSPHHRARSTLGVEKETRLLCGRPCAKPNIAARGPCYNALGFLYANHRPPVGWIKQIHRDGVQESPMSEHAQTLVDVEMVDQDAESAKQHLLDWLVQCRIIAADLTDCVLGDRGGYAPAENYGQAVGIIGAEAPEYGVNGLTISTGRSVYWGADLEAVTCPRCGHREQMAPREHSRWDTAFNDAMNSWTAGGIGVVACLGCGVENALNDWDWGYPWAFGTLGLTMWNWDPLSSVFIDQVSEVLGGHRLVHCAYKL